MDGNEARTKLTKINRLIEAIQDYAAGQQLDDALAISLGHLIMERKRLTTILSGKGDPVNQPFTLQHRAAAERVYTDETIFAEDSGDGDRGGGSLF